MTRIDIPSIGKAKSNILVGLLAGSLLLCSSFAKAADVFWEYAPYRIRVLLDVDPMPTMGQVEMSRLAPYISDRCIATAGAIWRVTIVPTQLPADQFTQLSPDLTDGLSPTDWEELDKLVLLRVSGGVGEYSAEAREFDASTRRWGPVVSRTTRQRGYVFRTVLGALQWAVSPVATFRIDRDDRQHVRLSVRARHLAPNADDFRQISPGDVLLPIFRSNDRDGRPRPDGIQPVPWTYLVADPTVTDAAVADAAVADAAVTDAAVADPVGADPVEADPADADPVEATVTEGASGDDELGAIRCTVYSGTRRPFGVRRRGRIDQFAIVARPAAATTQLQFVSRGDDPHPLPGCRVYERDSDQSFLLVGVSDSRGEIGIERGESPLRVLWVKSGHLLVAKMPVVPGIKPTLTIPLPDDESRLEIEGQLTAIRNALVDSVARRQVLAARFRERLGAGDLDKARSLLGELESLPTRAQFSQQIDRQERSATADDPQTQARIKKIFADTRVILGSYLDQRQVGTLHDQLNQAIRQTPKE